MVCSKVRSNDSLFSLFLDNKAEFQNSGKLKGCKLSSSLSSCLFEALKVCHLQDPTGQTDRQTEKQR